MTFSQIGVSFNYPRSWTYREKGDASSFTYTLVYLSNGPLRPVCRPAHPGVECGETIAVPDLAPGGIVVSWTLEAFPGYDSSSAFDRARGALIHLGQQEARVQIFHQSQHSNTCISALGGNEEIRAFADDSWEMDACIRGPGRAHAQAEVMTMLHTARLPAA